ncbi:MAG: hypothetical protein L6Q29_00775 [Candidatus Pacebacteria bacterium]|nr:hypothetical protein [Candidatus Paceibacterota bacterium]NUQ57076.1 hypothetical protein [Candidatus Paceibacter sp.]
MGFLNKIKKHWVALAVAFLAALAVGFPELYFVYEAGTEYKGAPLMGTDAEEHYLASMREASDGRYILSNVYSTPKNIPFLYPEGGEALAGFLSRITGLGVVRFNMAMKFVSPFVLFLLLYYLSLALGGKRSTAILAASFVILGSNLAARPKEILSVFVFGPDYHTGFNNYFRPINPEISSMLFFGYLALFYKLIKNPKVMTAAFLGVILGASFYFYLFTWTFLLVFTGLFLVFAIVAKNYNLAKGTLLTLATALLLSVPYWFEVFRAISSPVYSEAALRFGMVSGRGFFISGSLILVAVISGFLFLRYLFGWGRDIGKEASIFGALFGFSILIVYNQQVITGQSIQSPHYHFMSTILMLLFFAVFAAWHYIGKVKFFRNDFPKAALVALALVFLFLNNFKWQTASYLHVRQTAYQRQEYMSVMKWLDKNAPERSIIFGNVELSSLVPVFTPLDIYPSGFAQYYLLPGDVFKRYAFLKAWFSGVKAEEAESKFLGELRNKLSYEVYGIQYRKNMPDEKAINLAREYEEFRKRDLREILSTDYYKPTYFIFDQKFNELALPESEIKNVMEKVANIDKRFLIYKIKQ